MLTNKNSKQRSSTSGRTAFDRRTATHRELEAKLVAKMREAGFDDAKVNAVVRSPAIRVYSIKRGSAHEYRLSCFDREVNERLRKQCGLGAANGREVAFSKRLG